MLAPTDILSFKTIIKLKIGRYIVLKEKPSRFCAWEKMHNLGTELSKKVLISIEMKPDASSLGCSS